MEKDLNEKVKTLEKKVQDMETLLGEIITVQFKMIKNQGITDHNTIVWLKSIERREESKQLEKDEKKRYCKIAIEKLSSKDQNERLNGAKMLADQLYYVVPESIILKLFEEK